ncbi:SpoVR family protein [uncultured Rubinisphaera sp.]|uniref:SpoVR family protein n=1 Tax=uncultured Rubinisphaera sp. TaxID=1678686 RepID=UPI000EBE9956|nr:SpoVR family protein [Planctomycetaceae bacterium]|tara:strand:- start:5666 stop:7210 length:1545 start_codon:yes stop_codon:yes gene_type:complete
MSISTYRPLPDDIRAIQDEMEKVAASYGLDFYETIFEMLDYEELSRFAAYGGFPIRYPHWRFGAQFDELMKGYSYGLQKIYEMVINTDPCYAYLLNCNSITDQKLVIAHVYGHCDFFKNNAWFSKTNRRMLDQLANHAARINRYIDRYGHEAVEEFIDSCLSIEDLIDPYSPHIVRSVKQRKQPSDASEEEPETNDRRFRAKDYMDSFVNPQEVLDQERSQQQEEYQRQHINRSFPAEPVRDVLQFLIEHGQLREWQRDVLSIIREEAYYFAPQGQTKIMNEGWASYWHTTIMTNHGLTDAEVIDYADHHSGTMATSPTRLNPYKLGIELFRDIEERWNRGQFGSEWENCDDVEVRDHWDKELGLGREKIFEVRRIHNDITFIDTFLTEDFCRRHRMFSFAYNDEEKTYEIESREFKDVKQHLLRNLTNYGRPQIRVIDGNYRNRGELYLQHQFAGIELKLDDAEDTLHNVQKLWGRPVNLETVIDETLHLLTYDGQTHRRSPLTKNETFTITN